MANETGSISNRSSTIVRFSKEAAAARQRASGASKSESSDEVSVSASRSSVDEALSRVESRFVERANTVISTVRGGEAILKSARENVSESLQTARDLKKAIKDGDTEKAEALQKNLEELQARRERLSAEAKKFNNETIEDRSQVLSLGNKQIAAIRVGEVSVNAPSERKAAEVKTADDAEEAIQALERDKESLKAQVQEFRTIRKEIRSAIKEARSELTAIRKDSIETFDEASRATSALVQDARAGGLAALERSISERLSGDEMRRLIG